MNTITANIVQAARDALACSLSNETPVIELLVTRDVRVLGVARTCFVGGWERGQIELASEQHLWDSHDSWAHDPVPTVVAEVDEDGELAGRGIYTVEGVL